MTTKQYLDIDVYQAAQERIKIIFDSFERIIVSFSGGKDSGVLFNLAAEEAKKRCRKIAVMFIDLEAQYKLTIDYVNNMFQQYKEVIEPYWICLPINLRNSVSAYEPFWCCWEPGLNEKWVRQFPVGHGVISSPEIFDFWKYRMEFEEFVPKFAKWYSQGKLTGVLVGIRSDESLNRWRTIASITKTRYKQYAWTTKIYEDVYNCYPLYDWRTEDIWIANCLLGWKYNKLYDLFWKAGLSIHDMRICQPYGDDQRIGLDLFRVVEPETWAKVVNRVSGANFGNIYCGTKAIGYHKVKLPHNHTWESYTNLLLSSLPCNTRANYVDRFNKFIKYWRINGCGILDAYLKLLPNEAKVMDDCSSRGKKNKRIVKYDSVPDSLTLFLEQNKCGPSWRRMAACIIKNDHLCKSLSFTQTKNQVERMKILIQKYKSL